MITEDRITEIFCLADDFCKYFSSELKKHQLSDGKKHRNKPGRLSDAEVITILILFHSNGFRCLKHFYTQYVCKHQRILIHKAFKGITQRGKCSMGWFFDFKLHLIINDKGEILNFMFTPGNVDDREPLYSESFIENVKGRLCGDKGYIGKQLFEFLFMNGIQFVTKVKNNMKNSLMSVADKIMLRKRAIVESVNDELKNIAPIEHSRHRSFANFITNALSAIAAYCFFPKRPSISLEVVTDNQLTLF